LFTFVLLRVAPQVIFANVPDRFKSFRRPPRYQYPRTIARRLARTRIFANACLLVACTIIESEKMEYVAPRRIDAARQAARSPTAARDWADGDMDRRT
jgi:hypothetical protein